MDDLSRFRRQNPACPLHGQQDAGNLSVRDRYGKHQQIRLLHCNACKSRSSERKGTPLSHSCLPPERVVSFLQHLVEGSGVRQTERLVGVHRDTVMRLARMAGRHARDVHDELVASPLPPETREIRPDEMWSSVAKKRASCDPDDPADDHEGDRWDFLAHDAEHRLRPDEADAEFCYRETA